MMAWFTQGLGAKRPFTDKDATSLGRGLLEAWELGYRRAQADEVSINVGKIPLYFNKWPDAVVLDYLASQA